MTLTMYDSINVSQLPAGAAAYAGYTGGHWPTFASLQRMFPHAHLLSVAVQADEDADALDVENGDATIAQAPAWVKRQQVRGLYRPAVYASASSMGTLLHALTAAAITRASVRLWSAHYGVGRHICGPSTCKYPGVPACDGTQWTSAALGRDLDASLLLADFFDPAPKPKPAPREDAVPLNTGPGAVTPIAFRDGDSKVRFFPGSGDQAGLSVEFNSHPAVAVTLTGDAQAVDIPKGALGCRVIRGAAGVNVAVSVVTF